MLVSSHRAPASRPGLWVTRGCQGTPRSPCTVHLQGAPSALSAAISVPLGNGMATVIKAEMFTPLLQSRKVSLRGHVIVQKHKPEKGRERLRVQVRAESDSEATALLAGLRLPELSLSARPSTERASSCSGDCSPSREDDRQGLSPRGGCWVWCGCHTDTRWR